MRCARTLRISQSSASRKNHKSVGCADISRRNNRLFFKPMKRQLVSTMFNNQAYHVRGRLETKSTAFFTAGLDNRNWFKVNPDKKMDKWKRKELIRQRREYISFLLSSPYNRATKSWSCFILQRLEWIRWITFQVSMRNFRGCFIAVRGALNRMFGQKRNQSPASFWAGTNDITLVLTECKAE